MSAATIKIEDRDGQIAVEATLDGDYNPASAAHRTVQLLIAHLDEVMINQGQALPEEATQG